MRWELKHFILCGVLAATTFALAFVLGSGIILATGIPATGGVLNIFICTTLVALGILVARVPGFATLTATLIFLFAVPTVIGGPPGLHKILSGVAIGLVMDAVVLALGRGALGIMVAGALGAATSIASIFGLMVLLNLPGIDALRPLLLPLIGIQLVLGAAAGYTAHLLFNRRLVKLSAVKRLMATDGGTYIKDADAP